MYFLFVYQVSRDRLCRASPSEFSLICLDLFTYAEEWITVFSENYNTVERKIHNPHMQISLIILKHMCHIHACDMLLHNQP